MYRLISASSTERKMLWAHNCAAVRNQLCQFGWLRCCIQKPQLWYWNRRAVAGSVLIGLFLAMLPIPLQMVVAAFAAFTFNANLPLAVSLVWVSNPLTILPLGWICLSVGCALLGIDANIIPALSPESLPMLLKNYWAAALFGCLTCGLLLGIAGYWVTSIVWRLNTLYRWNRRKQR